MSVLCLFGFHSPSLASIAKRPSGLVALCEGCGRPMVKLEGGKWTAAAPLDTPIER